MQSLKGTPRWKRQFAIGQRENEANSDEKNNVAVEHLGGINRNREVSFPRRGNPLFTIDLRARYLTVVAR